MQPVHICVGLGITLPGEGCSAISIQAINERPLLLGGRMIGGIRPEKGD
jgi:hypothetical protein